MKFTNYNFSNLLLILGLFFFLSKTTTSHAQCILACNNQVNVSVGQDCKAEITVETLSPTATTDCPGAKIVEVLSANGTPIATSPFVGSNDIGKTYVVRIKHTASGNSCWGTIKVEDKIAPTLTCADVTIACGENFNSTAVVPNPIATDNCTVASLTNIQSIQDLDCTADPLYTVIVTRFWTAKDLAGNITTCTQKIYMKKGNLVDANFPENRDGVAKPALDCTATDLSPAKTGEPTMWGKPISSYCDIIANYTDQKFELCENSFKLLRTWTITDWCAGATISQVQLILVQDKKAPVITCPKDLTISTSTINCKGTITLPYPTVTDNCSSVAKIKTVFTCPTAAAILNNAIVEMPIGTHTVTVKATDDCGNMATCAFKITVQDKIPPTPVCDLNTKVSLGTDGKAKLTATTFDDGSSDNCAIDRFEISRNGATVAFGPDITFDCNDIDKKTEIILRVWDKNGNYNDCLAYAFVEDVLNPVIVCPGDKHLSCKADYNDLTLTGEATATDNCGIKKLSHIDLVTLNKCGEGEVKRTWVAEDNAGHIVTCAQYIFLENNKPFYINANNPNDPSDDVEWPQDAVATGCGISVEPASTGAPVIYQKSDCNLVAVSHEDKTLPIQGAACYQIIRTWYVIDWCRYLPNAAAPVGFWTYTQNIKVQNTLAPIISGTCADITVCADEVKCTTGLAQIAMTATDDCTYANLLVWKYTLDIDKDGTIDKIGDSPNVSQSLPLGVHHIKFSVTDGCGNITYCEFDITVKDCKKPTPICYQGLSISLMQDGTAALTAQMFNAGSYDNCAPGSKLNYEIVPQVVSCKDIGLKLVKFTVTDLAGNSDFCTTYIDVQNNAGVPCSPDSTSTAMASVAGAISNEMGKGVEKVMLKVNNTATSYVTAAAGNYIFVKPIGTTFEVKPEKNDDYKNGISTFDLLKMSRHILGVEKLDSPYKLIAADVNHNGAVTTSDLVELRKLILNINDKFAQNTSWRFVKSDFQFPDPSAPLKSNFPETAMYNVFDGNKQSDFVAVKIGDVNGSANPTSAPQANPRGNGTLYFNLSEQVLTAGTTYTVPVKVKDAENIVGYQFTIKFDANALELADVQHGELANLDESNFGFTLLDKGIITTSWNSEKSDVKDDEAVAFNLVFKARQNTTLSQVINFNSEYTRAEAYTSDAELLNVALQINPLQGGATTPNTTFELYQNKPNPFSDATMVWFNVPEPCTAVLTVMDMAGKVVLKRTIEANTGYNELSMNKENFYTTSGLLYYKLTTPTHSATKKMMLVE